MIEVWRSNLYFLGFLASLAFAARFILQWYVSEKLKKSSTPPLFWKLSLSGNILYSLHSLIQVQIHVCLVQVVSMVLSWRNLNLLKEPKDQSSFKNVLRLLAFALFTCVSLFALQGLLLYGEFDWVRTPTLPWQKTEAEKLGIAWHALGTVGIVTFASRFVVQWYQAEKRKKAELTRSFWIITIFGALISLVYFLRMGDLVHIIGQTMSLIPAIRNLQLIKNHSEA